MNFYETKEFHQRVGEYLQNSFNGFGFDFAAVDSRLDDYVKDVANSPDDHNLWELLQVIKFLRHVASFPFDFDWVKNVIRLEDVLQFRTDNGPKNITLSPVQVFQFASIYGPQHTVQEMKLVPKVEDGHKRMEWQSIDVLKRLVTNVVIMVPRKFGKTSEMVFFAIDDFLFGDNDAEIYCCSNSDKQSKILFDFIKFSLSKIDKDKKYIRMTLNEAGWKDSAKKKLGKTSIINSLSGGAETKDGLKASLRFRDEFGASKYVNGHSDAAALGEVIDSSMGTRKQPLSIDITTAGRVLDGPFQELIEGAKIGLLAEFPCEETSDYEKNDYQFSHIFVPDGWEMGDEYMGNEHLWRKCQPHLGYTVRSDYYQDAYQKAKNDPQKYIEFNTKLLNKFVSDQTEPWITSDDIRKLQGNRTIEDLADDDDWECFVGCDFSDGDDLCEMTYLCYNPRLQQYFIDCDAWITEECYEKAAKNPLYKRWADKGYIHICKSTVDEDGVVHGGRVIDVDEVVSRLMQVREYVSIRRIGYDRFDADDFIEGFRNWMREDGYSEQDIKLTIQPVSQLIANFNSPCQTMLRLVKMQPAVLEVSPNPIIPWCFGNTVLMVSNDGNANKKPTKAFSRGGKIDVVIGALEGIIMQDQCDMENL